MGLAYPGLKTRCVSFGQSRNGEHREEEQQQETSGARARAPQEDFEKEAQPCFGQRNDKGQKGIAGRPSLVVSLTRALTVGSGGWTRYAKERVPMYPLLAYGRQ